MPVLWAVLRLLHAAAQLTLTTSDAMKEELLAQRVVHPDRVQASEKAKKRTKRARQAQCLQH